MEDFLNGSSCKDCEYRLRRVISSEGLDLIDEQGKNISDDIYELHHEVCMKLDIELDHIVLECPLYTSKYNISDYFFTNKRILNLTELR